MVQAMDMVQLEVRNLSVDCQTGRIKDTLKNFSYTFNYGKAYGIIADSGTGGWALSYVLTGRQKQYDGKIFLNGSEIQHDVLKKYGCYAGEGKKHSFMWWEESVFKQLIREHTNKNYTIEQIIDMFELSSSRLNRKMEFVSNERWNASLAIGFACNKCIYGFPFLDTDWIGTIYKRLELCINLLKKHGAIILLPTRNSEDVASLVDEVIYL